MAKISARGATEVARIKTKTQSGHLYLWVMTSDGRILRRCVTPGLQEGYGVYRSRVPKNARTYATLLSAVQNLQHEVVSGNA